MKGSELEKVVTIRFGPHTATIPEYVVREAVRTVILESHASNFMRFDTSEKGIERALDEMMKWLILPTLRQLK
jgi:hypothetical protein